MELEILVPVLVSVLSLAMERGKAKGKGKGKVKVWVLPEYLAIAKALPCTPPSHLKVLRSDRAFWKSREALVDSLRFRETPNK
jgi:hypothetical protein